MGKKFKLLTSFVLTIILSVFAGTVSAEPYTINFDKETQKLVKSEGDIFDNADSAMPGDTITAKIQFKNSALTEREIFFYIKPLADTDEKTAQLLDNIDMSVYTEKDSTKNAIYDGKMSEAVLTSSEPTIYSLGKLKPGESFTYKAELRISEKLGNTYALSSVPLSWTFFISDSGLKVKTPKANPVGDTYMDKQDIELSCETDGADIYYTVDGSKPTKASAKYAGPITVAKNTTIQAYACKPEYEESDVMTEDYSIKCYPPVMSPGSGIYAEDPKVEMTSKTTGAVIYYTTDGSTPGTNSSRYTAPVSINKNTTIKAIAIKEQCLSSEVATENYKIKCITPEITPPGGTYEGSVSVTITSDTPESEIRYTSNGSTPTVNSKKYTEPIVVDKNSVVKAIAVKTGCEPSEAAQEEYKIKAEPPVIDPKSGEYTDQVSVTISHPDKNAKIYYTTDGAEPTSDSDVYNKPITVKNMTSIKAMAVVPEKIESDAVQENYEIVLSSPVIKPESGTFTDHVRVAISHKRPDVELRYTTDGTEPTEKSNLFNDQLLIEQSCTVTAKAFYPRTKASEAVDETYTIEEIVKSNLEPPTIDPKGGLYNDNIIVTISHTDPSAIIRYTTDGSEPIETSPIYRSPLDVDTNTVVSAKAFPPEGSKDKLPSSSVAEIYKIKSNPPTIEPSGGEYKGNVFVEIKHPSPNVTILYTTDGTDPSVNSTTYDNPVNVSENTVITAIAIETGKEPSEPVSEKYTIENLPPEITPKGGTYNDSVIVSIKHNDPDVTIRYTTDGSKPDENSLIYKDPFPISSNTTVTADAIKENTMDSQAVNETYKIKVSTPEITPKGGTYKEEIKVSIKHPDPDVTIRYTTDGSRPDETSLIYKEPFPISSNTIITADAIKENMEGSDPVSEEYKIELPAPNITPKGGTYDDSVTVTISSPVPNVTIRYTTDGSEPDKFSEEYTEPFKVDQNIQITAKSFNDDNEPSEPAVEVYRVKVKKPVISPKGGEYQNEVLVTITCDTPNSIIRYTTDGSSPTESSLVYFEPIKITEHTKITAIAYADDMEPSDSATEVYSFSIVGKVSRPAADPIGGTYSKEIDVSIHCETPDAVIRYTTDGTEPTENSLIYKVPIHVDKKITIKAIAVKPGLDNSDQMIETYTFKVAAPTATPLGGTYYRSQNVTLDCETPGVEIHFTLDKEVPSVDSEEYLDKIHLSKNTTIKAIATKPGWDDSDIMIEKYKMVKKEEPEVVTPPVQLHYDPAPEVVHAETAFNQTEAPVIEPDIPEAPITPDEVKTGVNGTPDITLGYVFAIIGTLFVGIAALSNKHSKK